MPSPFGQRRGPNTYYEYGGTPHHYIYNWTGMPMPGTRAAETLALGHYPDYPVAMTLETGRRSVLHSGPEQTHLIDAFPGSGLGAALLSRNERRLLIGVGLAGAAYLAWRKWGKKK